MHRQFIGKSVYINLKTNSRHDFMSEDHNHTMAIPLATVN